MELDRRILEELIYERVRVAVNLCQLVIFEQDLDKSIQRVLSRCDDGGEGHTMAHEYIDKAWLRLQDEWCEMRTCFDGDGDE